jgi:hypothetical protein
MRPRAEFRAFSFLQYTVVPFLQRLCQTCMPIPAVTILHMFAFRRSLARTTFLPLNSVPSSMCLFEAS